MAKPCKFWIQQNEGTFKEDLLCQMGVVCI